MAENKTKPTEQSVEEHLAAIGDEQRRQDCHVLVKLLSKVTQEKPKMWGTSIVGFGKYHYRYESGHEGDSSLAGFASRKGDISIYLTPPGPEQQALLAKLGKHKMGKGCLYIKKVSDIDLAVLEQLVASSIAELRRRYSP